MNLNRIKSAFFALIVAFSIVSSFGIGAVSAQTTLPYEDTGISDDTDTIDYEIVANDSFADIGDGTNTEVNATVTITGINETESGDETTELLSESYTLSEGENVSESYNVTEENRDEFDRFSVTIDSADSNGGDYIDDISVVIESVGGDGGGAATTKDNVMSFLNSTLFGIPVFAWLVLVGVGAFIFYNDNEDF